MTVYETTISKIQQLPEPLVQEVNDFIDFLLVKQDRDHWQLWTHFRGTAEMAESGFSEYLADLEAYEDRLSRGEIRW